MTGERYVEMSLSELLTIVKPTYAAKRVIGVTLARSILHLFEGPWLSSCTSIDDVYVYCKVQNDRPFPLFDKVFIATQFGVCNDQRRQKSGTYKIHPFPTILALGVILMEIELGEDVSEIKTEPSFASKRLNPYYAAQHLLKEFRKRFNLDSGLLLAVKFCIERESFAQLKTLDSEALLSDQEFIDTYYNRIVRPLEEDLVKGAHWTWDQVNQLKSPSSDDAGVCKVFTKGPMQGAHKNFFGLRGHGARQRSQNEYTSSTNGPKKHEQMFSSVRQPRLFQVDRESYLSGKTSIQSEKEVEASDHDITNMQEREISSLVQPNLTQSKSSRPRNRDDFNVAIICALQIEANAVQAIFEDHWDDDGVYQYGKQPKDTNSYSAGSIGGHNVVLAHQPRMGRATAANVASVCSMSFTNLKLVLVVGVCGGVPVSGNKQEILLGDVVISKGIVPYDFGRQYPGQFRRKTTINDQPGRPDMEISSLIARLETTINQTKLQEKISSYLFESNNQSPGNKTVCYPGQTEDKLFPPEYIHKHHDASTRCGTCINGICDTAMESSCRDLECDERQLVSRTRMNQENKPCVHFGLIASGDTVLKSATDRDRIAKEAKVIAFEMEGSGVWDTAPCVIIKGVCDYADSHKNKLWQDYAAMTAAASAKAFLRHWSVNTRLAR